MKVIILAGGLGTRLSEETSSRPKPMVEIGRMPMLWRVMNIYVKHGYSDFMIACGYKGEVIKEYFRNFIAHNSDLFINLRDGSCKVANSSAPDWQVGHRVRRKWEAGYHVVYGVRSSRKESWWINSTRQLFYRIIDSLSEDDLPLDAGDFRLVDRCVLNELRKFEDYQPYLRGTIAALGFEQIGIPYERGERDRGQSKFSVKQLIGLALDGIFNHSVVPLCIATYLGLAISCATLLAIVGYLVGRLFLGKNWPPGFATIIALILGSLSLNALFLGIIGEYLGRIYRQVKRRPLTMVEREVNAVQKTSRQAAQSTL